MQSLTASVSVDRDFARFGSKSYAINKINTVDVRSRHPHSQAAMLLWGLGAFVCIFFGPVGWILAFVCGALAYFAWRKSQIVEYCLYLITSSSEQQALKSTDEDFISDLRERIEAAMSGRAD
jgi:hypothetical protein